MASEAKATVVKPTNVGMGAGVPVDIDKILCCARVDKANVELKVASPMTVDGTTAFFCSSCRRVSVYVFEGTDKNCFGMRESHCEGILTRSRQLIKQPRVFYNQSIRKMDLSFISKRDGSL